MRMTNDELKKKIAEIIQKARNDYSEFFRQELKEAFRKGEKHFGNRDCSMTFYDYVADALIAARIGDVKDAELDRKAYEVASNQYRIWFEEQKHRAEVAERALKHMASDYWGVECFCHGCYESGCRKSCGEKYLIFDEEDAVNCLVKNFLQQAEKELAEEGKDG